MGRLPRLKPGRSRLVAGVTALALNATLCVAVTVLGSWSGGSAPQQSVWGSAAHRPHRVAASATMKHLARGRVVADGATGKTPVLSGARRPKTAVPQSSKPAPIRFPVRGRPGRQTVTAQPKPPVALPALRGFDPKTSREIPAQSSANKVVYANADGTRTARVYQSPVNWQRPGGSWTPIDTSLVPVGPVTASMTPSIGPSPDSGAPSLLPSPTESLETGLRGWMERSAAQEEVFAPFADQGPLVRLSLDASHTVGFSIAGAAHTAGVVGANTVTYPGALGAAGDIRFTAGTGSVEEQLVLRSVAAATSWVFPLELSGLHAVAGSDGSVGFADASGRVRAVMPHGSMSDSKVNSRSGDGALSDGVRYSLTSVAGRPALRMDLDRGWLTAKSRVFPVTVRPSLGYMVGKVTSDGTTYVTSSDSSDHSGETEIKSGTYDGGTDKALALMKFGGMSTTMKNDYILAAELGVFNTWSSSCAPRTAYVYPVNSSWSVTGGKSWPGPSIGAAVGRASFAGGFTPVGASTPSCPSGWHGFVLGNSQTAAGIKLLNGWTHGTIANNGLAIGASSTDSLGWKKFASDNSNGGDPYLSLTYTTVGASYKLASTLPVKQVTNTTAGQIKVTVKNLGADVWTPASGYELSYRAYDAQGHLVADHPVFTPMPSNVAPGSSITLNATVNALPIGSYALVFDMYANVGSSSPTSFTSQGVTPLAVGLTVPDPPPVVVGVYPPSGFVSSTVSPQLWTSAKTTSGKPMTYDFHLTCDPLPGTFCPPVVIDSGKQSVPYWTVSPPMTWDMPYTWSVTVSDGVATPVTVGPVGITPAVPQPVITSHLGASSGQVFDPQTGDYTTAATDASVSTAGPPLQIGRSYNSLDTRVGGAFGAGWSTAVDMAVTPDNDGTGNVVVTMADGSQARFGNNGIPLFAPPVGSPDNLTHNTDGTWTLVAPGQTRYDFTSAGKIAKITDSTGLTQTYTLNGSGQVSTITDTASGRALHLNWVTPPGATAAHVNVVSTDPPATGQAALSWAYNYTGDDLSGVCAPNTAGCTTYTYGQSSSHYRNAVMDSGPRSYYRLGDAVGSATAASEVDTNLGTDNGTYANTTLGTTGPLAGAPATAATFNGYSSYAALANNVISDSTYVSAELWFKTTGGGGVLLGYSADPITTASAQGNLDSHDPALYVGGDGKLRGEFWDGSAQPITSAGAVTDGNWHHAVLSAAGTVQSLYLDGSLVGSLYGRVDPQTNTHVTAGAGFWMNWPDAITTTSPAVSTDPAGHFSGSIAEVAVYDHPLGSAAVTSHYNAGHTSGAELTQVTLPSGRVYNQAAYDTTRDRVTDYTDPAGGQWSINPPSVSGFMANNESLGKVTRAVTVADPDGRNEVYDYDALAGGRIISYDRGAGNAPRTFGYDAAGHLDAVTDEDGNTVTMTNDSRGNVTSRSWSAVTGCPPTGVCTTYYNYYLNTANPTDPRNDQVTQVRDGRSASATDNTYLTGYGYNTAGQLTTKTLPATADFPNGRTTTDAYSAGTEAAVGGGTIPAGLLTSVSTPGSAVTSYAYYSNGDLAQVTEPSGRRTTFGYDNLGRAITRTEYSDSYPAGLVTTYTNDAMSRPVTITYPGVHDQVSGVTHTRADTYTYDADGDTTQVSSADTTGGDPTRLTTASYDDHGQTASVTDPAGDTTGYTYDTSGRPISVIDPAGNERTYTYNEYGEATQTTLHTGSGDPANPDGGHDLVLESDAYDPAGLLAARTDAIGRITNYFYDHDQKVVAVQQQPSTGPGRQTAYTYDSAGNVISTAVSDLPVTTSTVTNYSIDDSGRTTSVTVDPPPAGQTLGSHTDRTTSYAYNADDHPTTVTIGGPSGSAVTDYGYNTAGETTSQTVHDGTTNLLTTWTRDQRGLPLTETDPRGNVSGGTPANFTTNYGYDEAGQLATVTSPPVTTQSYGQQPSVSRPVSRAGYDTFGDPAQSEDANGNITATGYDGDGNPTSVTGPAYTPPGATTPITPHASATYNPLGELSSATDPAGNATSYGYDALGDLTSRTDPQLTGQSAPGVSTFGYDNAGEQLNATDPTGAENEATYDYFGDPITATNDIRTSGATQHNTTTTTYDYLGDPTQTVSPTGVTTTNLYDHVGELTSTSDVAGFKTIRSYDYAGRPSETVNPDGTYTTYGYDPAGNLLNAIDYGSPPAGQTAPVARTRSFGYDPAGNLLSATDGRGNTSTFSYDATDELTKQIEPVTSTSSITTAFSRDAAGNRTGTTDGRGNTTWDTYNAWNLPESVVEPATAATPNAPDRTTTTAYDSDGRPATETQPGGVTVTSTYDQLSNLLTQSGTGADAPSAARTYGYDLDSRLTSAVTAVGTDTIAYNDAGEPTATTGPSGAGSFSYNADGNLSSRTDTSGSTGYTYDQDGRPATTTDPLTGATLTYGYSPESLITSVAYKTGSTVGPTRTLGYDQLHNPASDTLTSASGTVLSATTYVADPNGNLTSKTTSAGTTTYGYDQANRLTSATTGGTTTNYGYDASGNLTQDGAATNTYDARDQLTGSTTSAGTTGYTWTPRGTLATTTAPGGQPQTTTTDAYGQTATSDGVSYGYDALGRLNSRTTNGNTTNLTYSGTSNDVVSDGTQNYSYDPTGTLVGAKMANGTSVATLTDSHSDVTGTFSPSTNAVSGSTNYDPVGNTTSSTGTQTDLGYQSNYTDPTSHQVNMGVRWYNPGTGAFTSHDTVGNDPTPASINANPYTYANGSPLTNVDPTGQDCCGACQVSYGGGDGDCGNGNGGCATGYYWNGNNCVPANSGTCTSGCGGSVGCSSGCGNTGSPGPGSNTGNPSPPAPPPPPRDPWAGNPNKPVPPPPSLKPVPAMPTVPDSPWQIPPNERIRQLPTGKVSPPAGMPSSVPSDAFPAEPVFLPPGDPASPPKAPLPDQGSKLFMNRPLKPGEMEEPGFEDGPLGMLLMFGAQPDIGPTPKSELPIHIGSEWNDNTCDNSYFYAPLYNGRASFAWAHLCQIGPGATGWAGSKASKDPLGFPDPNVRLKGGGWLWARGHLIARSLGGPGDSVNNLIPVIQNPINSPYMSSIEKEVKMAVLNGQVVDYYVTPIYSDSTNPVPWAIHIVAYGSGGLNINVCLENKVGGSILGGSSC
jgi:RHS repeat-associated protein